MLRAEKIVRTKSSHTNSQRYNYTVSCMDNCSLILVQPPKIKNTERILNKKSKPKTNIKKLKNTPSLFCSTTCSKLEETSAMGSVLKKQQSSVRDILLRTQSLLLGYKQRCAILKKQRNNFKAKYKTALRQIHSLQKSQMIRRLKK